MAKKVYYILDEEEPDQYLLALEASDEGGLVALYCENAAHGIYFTKREGADKFCDAMQMAGIEVISDKQDFVEREDWDDEEDHGVTH